MTETVYVTVLWVMVWIGLACLVAMLVALFMVSHDLWRDSRNQK